jgi:hypothetical protein
MNYQLIVNQISDEELTVILYKMQEDVLKEVLDISLPKVEQIFVEPEFFVRSNRK